jgi:hypothetical protein
VKISVIWRDQQQKAARIGRLSGKSSGSEAKGAYCTVASQAIRLARSSGFFIPA